MSKFKSGGVFILGGICGIAGTLSYVLSNLVPLNHIPFYVFVMAWPVLSIIFIFSLYSYISLEHKTVSNQLSFIFGCLAFTLMACMISVQLAVRWGIEEYINESPDNEPLFKMILKSVRLVDQGIDVAWDLFIGTALIFLSLALKGHARFGIYWSIPAALLGILLIVLNVITFPWPPDTMGLFDVGPIIGIYIITLSARLTWIGIHFTNPAEKIEV